MPIDLLSYALPVVIGAFIGYITNWLAIKMLFRPRRAYHLFGRRLPFTPGLIPKERDRIALALGKSVSGDLLNAEVLKKALLSEETLGKMEAFWENALQHTQGLTVQNLLTPLVEEETLTRWTDQAKEAITEGIITSLKEQNMGEKVAKEMADYMVNSIDNPLIKAFLSGSLVGALTHKAAEKIDDFIKDQGPVLLRQWLDEQTEKLMNKKIDSLTAEQPQMTEQLKTALKKLYPRLIENHFEKLLSALDITSIVAERIKAMDIKEFEKLLLSIINKELAAITWLGALLGGLIGIINIFIA